MYSIFFIHSSVIGIRISIWHKLYLYQVHDLWEFFSYSFLKQKSPKTPIEYESVIDVLADCKQHTDHKFVLKL